MTPEQIIHSLYSKGRDKQAIEAAERINLAHKLQMRRLVRKLQPFWSDQLVKEYAAEFLKEDR